MFHKLFKYYFYLVILFFMGRVILFVHYFDRFSDDNIHYWFTFLYGLKMDTIVASMLLVIPALLLTLSPKRLAGLIDTFLRYYFLIVFSILIYIENATFPFFAEYDLRPNYLFVEYLEYPKEVFDMLIADYKMEFGLAIAMIGLFGYFFLKFTKKEFVPVFDVSYSRRLLLFLPVGLLLFIGIRSSFGHRPANLSDAMFSTDRIINEVTKNSIYSIGYAVYATDSSSGKSRTERYGKMETKEALQRVRSLLNIQSDSDCSPLERTVATHFKTDKPKNLVIFLQESLGAQFVAAVGGEEGITPHLNRLAGEGVLFTDAYSNGTRSIRGIAGMVAGNFSIPGKGIVKRNKSQNNLFTIASLLEPYGYRSMFFYGGESRFDNMRGWFSGNGFDEIIDESSFKNPDFVGTWGVCDGEVVDKANERFKQLHTEHKKFAAVIFSTSNHKPFDFPENKIDLLPNVEKKSVKNAIKYADFAIGKMIENARREGYYDDTVFVVVADHNIRVYGDDMVPVNMFHIPALILGGGIEPMHYDKIATQPDVLASALDLLGLDLTYPIMGNTIFGDKKRNIDLMQFHDFYALRSGNRVAVARPDKPPETFTYENGHLKRADHDKELEKNLLAFIITLDDLYEKRLYTKCS